MPFKSNLKLFSKSSYFIKPYLVYHNVSCWLTICSTLISDNQDANAIIVQVFNPGNAGSTDCDMGSPDNEEMDDNNVNNLYNIPGKCLQNVM